MHKCTHCGAPIAQKRVFAAMSRGYAPMYCSSACGNRARNQRAYRKAKASAELSAVPSAGKQKAPGVDPGASS